MFARSSLRTAWHLQQVPLATIVRGTWRSIVADRLVDRAAELGFYFLFALFPTLFCASSILGLAARSASQFYDQLLQYLALVLPSAALGTVLNTFNETTAAASSGKITFGLLAAVWSASVGVSAIQDALNSVYGLKESRSYVMARLQAIALTIVLICIFTVALSSMLGGDFFAALCYRNIHPDWAAQMAAVGSRTVGWILAAILLTLFFAVIYYWAPDLKTERKWRWLTPGGLFGIMGWLLASLGLRLYLHFFNTYSITYGSLGAVIILLTWFYISGLMLLLGAEVNHGIEQAVALRENAAARSEPTL